MEKGKITVMTATYNRKNTISRVYNSLKSQTYKNFEWIVIDDGSTDNTNELIEKWKNEADFPIYYYYQENQGKHKVMAKALKLANGEYFTSIDSDDEIKPNSFNILIKEWNKIQKEQKNNFISVTARCYDPVTKKVIGGRKIGNIRIVLH